jgi:AraC-like DNA-binding protein
MSRIASVVPVDRAIALACASGRAFAGDADGRGCLALSSADVRLVVELCIAGRGYADTSGRLASRLRLDDSGVTERHVSIIWREARRSMQAYLAARKLIPRVRAHETTSQEDDTMAHLPGYELEGIKEIASYLGVSEATVNRFITRDASSNPLRVVKYCNRWHASKAEIESWRSREMRRPAA